VNVTETEIISTWRLIDMMSKHIIPVSLDRESLVSEVLIKVYHEEQAPSPGDIRRRLIDALRSETKYDRAKKEPRRREMCVGSEVLDKLILETNNQSEVDDRDEVNRLMALVHWSPLEERFIFLVFYEGMSLKDAGRVVGLNVGQSFYLWCGVKARFMDIRNIANADEDDRV